MHRAGFLLLSGAVHAGLVLALALAPGAGGFEPPRLGPRLVSVRLLPAADGAAAAVQAAVTAGAGPAAATQDPALPAARDPQRATQPDAWLPSGRLTRLPVPLDPVDLDPAEMQPAGFSGRIELTLLVDRHGRVRDVLSNSRDPGARAFADRVAGRFRAARFTPGEIDGVPVNALLKIAVVSERSTSADM